MLGMALGEVVSAGGVVGIHALQLAPKAKTRIAKWCPSAGIT
jgi:hypothetical protein